MEVAWGLVSKGALAFPLRHLEGYGFRGSLLVLVADLVGLTRAFYELLAG